MGGRLDEAEEVISRQQSSLITLAGVDQCITHLALHRRAFIRSIRQEMVFNAQGREFLVEPVVAAEPAAGDIAGEPDEFRLPDRVNVQQGGILSARFPAAVHFVERRSFTVKFVVIKPSDAHVRGNS